MCIIRRFINLFIVDLLYLMDIHIPPCIAGRVDDWGGGGGGGGMGTGILGGTLTNFNY